MARRGRVRGALAGAVLVLAAAAAAQPAVQGPGRPLPRTADGRPDLSGVWQAMSTANVDIEAHSAARDVPAGLGVVEGGELPYQPWALARREEHEPGALSTRRAGLAGPGLSVLRVRARGHAVQAARRAVASSTSTAHSEKRFRGAGPYVRSKTVIIAKLE